MRTQQTQDAGDAVLAERQYRSVVAAASDAIVVIDANGIVLEWNHAAESIFGHSATAAVGRELATLIIPGPQRDRHRIGLAAAVSGDRGDFIGRHVEVLGQRADGSTVPIELSITTIGHDDSGSPLFSGFLRDITERLRLTADLHASRARLVQVSDEARRQVERDLHDGAQQQLVGVAIELANVDLLVDEAESRAVKDALLVARGHLTAAIAELRELARGIHPESLVQRGLPGAVHELARRSAIPVHTRIDVAGRLPEPVETAAYFVVSEALTNASKHGATEADIHVWVDDTGVSPVVRCTIRDDGPGGADPHSGTGLTGLRDRVTALGGDMGVRDHPAGGTELSAAVPLP